MWLVKSLNLVYVAIYTFIKRKQLTQTQRSVLFVLILTTLLHIAIGKEQTWERYIAYLWSLMGISLAILLYSPALATEKKNLSERSTHKLSPSLLSSSNDSLISGILSELAGKPIQTGLIVLYLCVLGFVRVYPYFSQVCQGTDNIYRQQYRMAEFVARYYPTSNVALNDIGIVCFRTDIHLTDLAGLATKNTIGLFTANYDLINSSFIERLCNGNNVELIICYPHWFQHSIPKDWVLVGAWYIHNNVACGGDEVRFYARSKQSGKYLHNSLREFDRLLPINERTRYFNLFNSTSVPFQVDSMKRN